VPRQTPDEITREIVKTIKEAGWRQTGRGRFSPPVTLTRLTPPGTPDSWWGSPMYPVFRFVDVAAVQGARPTVWTVDIHTPWVTDRTVKLPVTGRLDRIREFIRQTEDDGRCGFTADGPRRVPVMTPPRDRWGNLI
jgi:hypothetical protein